MGRLSPACGRQSSGDRRRRRDSRTVLCYRPLSKRNFAGADYSDYHDKLDYGPPRSIGAFGVLAWALSHDRRSLIFWILPYEIFNLQTSHVAWALSCNSGVGLDDERPAVRMAQYSRRRQD